MVHYSSSIVSRKWYFQKTAKMSTAGYRIVKVHGFHTTMSGIKKNTKKPQTHTPTPQLLKTIRQSKKKNLQKAKFCLSLALLSRELTILVSNVWQTRMELGHVPCCIPWAFKFPVVFFVLSIWSPCLSAAQYLPGALGRTAACNKSCLKMR